MNMGDKVNIKYEYENEGQYLIAQYKEQLEFALYQVESQYESAKKREEDEKKDLRVFLILLGIILLMFPLSILIALSGSVVFSEGGFVLKGNLALGMLGCVLMIADIPFLLYVVPFCLYKILRGVVLIQINKQSRMGRYICKKWKLDVFSSERRQCEEYIRKYRLVLQELDELADNLYFDNNADLMPIKERMKQVDIKPKVRVVNSLYGIVNQKIKVAAIVVTVLVYLIAWLLLRQLGISILDVVKELFGKL